MLSDLSWVNIAHVSSFFGLKGFACTLGDRLEYTLAQHLGIF